MRTKPAGSVLSDEEYEAIRELVTQLDRTGTDAGKRVAALLSFAVAASASAEGLSALVRAALLSAGEELDELRKRGQM